MEAACARHGRDPVTLGRHVGVAVVLPGHALRFPGGLPLPHAKPLTGSHAEVAAQLAAFADEGVDHLTIYAQPMTAEGLDWSRPSWPRCAASARRAARVRRLQQAGPLEVRDRSQTDPVGCGPTGLPGARAICVQEVVRRCGAMVV